MSKNMKRKGVTLIELLIVVLILAALAVIAIPRVSQSAAAAKTNACATNVDLINSAIEMYYANANPNAYPAALTDVTGSATYFPDGAPTCPLGGTYTMGANHRVTCNHP
jgi:prepilin-type N-terminal cleavage/methylation domain-containing protein